MVEKVVVLHTKLVDRVRSIIIIIYEATPTYEEPATLLSESPLNDFTGLALRLGRCDLQAWPCRSSPRPEYPAFSHWNWGVVVANICRQYLGEGQQAHIIAVFVVLDNDTMEAANM